MEHTKSRKKSKAPVSLAVKKAKLEKAREKIALAEAKLKIEELSTLVINTNIAQIFADIKKTNKKIKDIDVLMTIASVLKIKAIPSPRSSLKKPRKK